ncbi:hypothetical protein LJB99_01730 [Deltaproteobacteria bacterium OttesenSCG-928-K17]|nr:hypothetical protein [Deltaproteobacteria bacterium OttesenSCG-928-K17]
MKKIATELLRRNALFRRERFALIHWKFVEKGVGFPAADAGNDGIS